MAMNTKIDRDACGSRGDNGMCLPMGIPCGSVGDSICKPIQKAHSLGEYSAKLAALHSVAAVYRAPVHFYGSCPICNGTPEILMPSAIERLFFAKGPMVVCSKCNARLLSTNSFFAGDEITLHIPETVSEQKAKLIREGFTSEQADEIITDGK